jgi:hypothetical protein
MPTRRNALSVLCGGLLLLMAAQAHANGLQYLGVFLLIVGLAIAMTKVVVEVTVEAITYRYALPLGWGRAWLSALAASVAGTVAAVAVASGMGSQWATERWGLLVVPLLVALLAEIGLVWALNHGARLGWRLPVVVALANIAGWALCLAVAWGVRVTWGA